MYLRKLQYQQPKIELINRRMIGIESGKWGAYEQELNSNLKSHLGQRAGSFVHLIMN